MIITRLLVAPGLEVTTRAGRSVCSVGLVLDDKRVVWGDCVHSESTIPLSLERAGESIEKMISPALVERRLEGFRTVSGIIESLRESVLKEELTALPAEESQLDGISRREFITGRLRAESQPPSPPRLISTEQSLHPALRYGISQALLQAVALDCGISVPEVIVREYKLPCPTAVIPLLAQLDTDRPLETLPMPSPSIVALGYIVPKGDPAEILGDNGVILQRFIRMMKEKMVAMPGWDSLPRFHIDLRGGLGALYGNNIGQMLGALVGLEMAAKPMRLLIENADTGDSPAEAARWPPIFPGATQFTRTPLSPNSIASALVSPTIPAFAAET